MMQKSSNQSSEEFVNLKKSVATIVRQISSFGYEFAFLILSVFVFTR